jgi:hypothetical protein
MAENAALTGDFTDPSAFMEAETAPDAEEVNVASEEANDETPDATSDEAATGDKTDGEEAPTDDSEDDLLAARSSEPLLDTLSEEGKRAYDALPEAERKALAADFGIASQGAQLLQMLEHPEKGAEVFKELATRLGFDGLLRDSKPVSKTDATEKTADDFASDGEWELYQLSQAEKKRADTLESRLEQLEKRQSGQDREAKLAAYVNTEFDGVSKEVASRYGGYRINKEMLKEAVDRFPSLTPVQAVAARFSDRLYKHGVKVAADGGNPKNQGPNIVKGAGAKGSEIRLTAEPTDPKAFMRG